MKKFSIVSFAVIAASFTASELAAQTPAHRYNLDVSYADANGGPSLGSDGGSITASGYAFGPNQGLTLQNAFADAGTYSIAIRSLFTGSTYNGYRKIVDFKDRVTDLGYYSNPSDAATLFNIASGPNSAYATNGVMQFTVITRDASTNLFAAYINGVQQFVVNDAGGYGVFSAANNIARFFEDDLTGLNGEASNGVVDYIAIYDSALTSSEVAGIDVITGTVTPEPASLVLLGTGLLGVVGVVRRRRTEIQTV